MSAKPDKLVMLGRVSGVHGVKGWVKVRSFTQPRANIASFKEWTLRRDGADRKAVVEAAKATGTLVLVKLRGIDDRDRAAEWIGADVAVERSRLPACAPGEYYWADLEGLEVRTPTGDVLGTVDHLVATGSNDVLVLAGAESRMVPFVLGEVIRHVDLEAGVIVAEWGADF